jgi:hypothetical protein
MRKEKTQVSKIRNDKGREHQITETTLRTYIPINWKILKKGQISRNLLPSKTEPRGY